MITAGIKDAKNNLSRYIESVKTGEEVIITDRGKPVARLVRVEERKRSIHASLAPLIGKGLIIPPSQELNKDPLSPTPVAGKPVSEMVIEDRR